VTITINQTVHGFNWHVTTSVFSLKDLEIAEILARKGFWWYLMFSKYLIVAESSIAEGDVL